MPEIRTLGMRIFYADILSIASEVDFTRDTQNIKFEALLHDVNRGGLLFDVDAPNYHSRAEFVNKKLVFSRNGVEVSLPLGPLQTNVIFVSVGWSPTEIVIDLRDYKLDPQGRAIGWNRRFELAAPTNFTVVPPLLRRFVLTRGRLDGNNRYDTAEDLLRTIINVLAFAEMDMRQHNTQKLMWTRGRPSKPIPEPDATRFVGSLLSSYGNTLAYHVITEPRAGAGDLDIHISAITSLGAVAQVAIEAKKANSRDVVNGLQHQLPAYMASINADFGIYLIYWFRSSHFAEPSYSRFHDFQMGVINPTAYQGNIRVLGFDFSLAESPSKPKSSLT
jgi:hypothetical protein